MSIDFRKFSKDINYQLGNFAQGGTVANEQCIGLLGPFAKQILENAVFVNYKVSGSDLDNIIDAIPNSLVLYKPDGSQTAHAPLKFLSEYLLKSILKINFDNKHVKLVGPKLNKKEMSIRNKSLHCCFMNPDQEDHYRALESTESNEKKTIEIRGKIAAIEAKIKIYKDAAGRNVFSNMGQSALDNLTDLTVEKEFLNAEQRKLQTYTDVIVSRDPVENELACNRGIENCNVKCDIVISFDSFYDVNLSEAFTKFNSIGASEVYISLILPFGLLFVDHFRSEELGVQFRRKNGGFTMTHTKDLSNGYTHTTTKTVFEIMNNSFIKTSDGMFWQFEIVESIAEICLLKCTQSRLNRRIIRKLVPPKYDKYSVIMNPLAYFGPLRTHKPMLIETEKLEAAVGFVERLKSNGKVIQDTFAFVQSLFMRVLVGSTMLQPGGAVCNREVAAIVLHAMIEAALYTHDIGMAFNRSRPRGFIRSIWDSIVANFKSGINECFPNLYKFLTYDRVEKYMAERFELRDLELDSNLDHKYTFVELVEISNEFARERYAEYCDACPTVFEIFEKRINLFELLASRCDVAINGRANQQLPTFSNSKYQNEFRKAIQRRYEEAAVTGIKISENNLIAEIDEIDEDNNMLEHIKIVSESETTTLDETEYVENIPGKGKEVVDYNIPNELPQHDQSRKLTDLESHMSDLSLSALNFNMSRMENGVVKRPFSLKEKENLVKTFTREPVELDLKPDPDSMLADLVKLRDNYVATIATRDEGRLTDIKANVIVRAKEAITSRYYEKFDGSQKQVIIMGKAGAGKTKFLLDHWDSNNQDMYIAPFAKIVMETNTNLNIRFSEKTKHRVKTYEKVCEMNKKDLSGEVCYIDECLAMPREYWSLILCITNFKKYVFLGDDEQTTCHDFLCMLRPGLDVVRQPGVGQLYYTFRYGPTVAAFLNYTFNYPVFSLRDTDTDLNYVDIDDLNERSMGLNICSSRATIDRFFPNVDIITANSSQGTNANIVNVIGYGTDNMDFVNFRSTGIVACSRATEELNIYCDFKSKATGLSKNALAFANNFATQFKIVLPNVVDF